MRPNLHIDDYSEVCKKLCEAESDKIKDEIFNVGYENMSILDVNVLDINVLAVNGSGPLPLYIVSKSVLHTLYSVKKCLIHSI